MASPRRRGSVATLENLPLFTQTCSTPLRESTMLNMPFFSGKNLTSFLSLKHIKHREVDENVGEEHRAVLIDDGSIVLE